MPDGAFIVPDPNLIFHGEFKRAGLDLVLSHEGHEFVVHDYFRGDKRAAIASPDGAHLTGDVVNALTGHVQYAQAAPGAAAAQVIGHVTKLSGSATAIRNGVSVILNNGDNVEKGDVVSTGADSTLGITFIDGTVFGLSSNARMVLNEMVYDPNGSSNSSLLSLVAGTITFVAGETAKHGDMKVDTPVATMGIRGTAVLTQINFVVPAGGGDPQPQASFQVLVEPNGTTGSYILFDKVTLLPIATVNQAGQMIQISGGSVSITNALMSPDVQKLITDVFTLKFTDNNTNTKLTTNFTDTITQTSEGLVIKTPAGYIATAVFTNLNPQGSGEHSNSTQTATRVPGQPLVQSLDLSGNVKAAFALTERADVTGDTTHADTVSGRITFVDQNPGDRPTVSVSLADAPNYVYKNAGQQDVTGSLSALQKQDIAATQIDIQVVADGANNNNGSAVWTYTIPDHVFDFLAAGETLTLTYMVRIDNNFAVNPESKFIPITITITGTNDKPTVATSGGTVIEKVGTGNEALDTITGTVIFTDVDLTDRPIVSAALSSTQPFKYFDAEGNDITVTLTPEQRAAIAAVEVPLTVVQGAGNGNNGSATWTYSVPDHLFDFLAEGETLTLNYVVQVDDGHGGVVSTPITVSINGADVNVEGTNDLPTIVEDSTTPTGAVQEDTAATLLAGGTIAFNDPDLTDTHTASFALKSTTSSAHLPGFGDGTSHIGTFALTAVSESPGVSTRGSVGWTFTLNDNDPVLQSLAEGQTITQVYTVTVDDHHGGVVTQDVTVTITGTNDAPTVTSSAADATGAVTEDAGATLSIDGTLAIQDLDLIDTHAAQAVFKSSTSSAHLPGFDDDTPLGTFTIDASVHEFSTDTNNGATLGWHFSLDNNNAVLQSLAQGQTITQVYTVTFTDDHGAHVSQDVTVTINGANDAPTITSGSAAATGAVTEDDSSSLTTGGTLAIKDLDLIDTHTAAWSFKSSSVSTDLPGFGTGSHIGTFSIDPSVTESSSDTSNGATLGWHFNLDNSDPVLQSLAEGQTITQVYTVTFDDQHGGKVSQDVTVTITGTNDAPAVSYVTSNYMNFDGHTIAVGDVPTVATDDVTLDGWVNWNGSADPGHGQVLFYNGNTSTTGFGLLGTVNADGTMELQILAGGVEIADTGVALTASQWHNIALTRDNGTFTLYLDGHLEYSQSWAFNAIDGSPSNPSHSYMMIGAASDSGAPGFGAEGFFGSIADVSVWTTALTQAQIQSIDFTALTGSEANLAAYYQLADGSGSTAANTVNSAQGLTIEGNADWASGTSGPGGAVADLTETNAGQLSHGVLAVSDVDAIDHVTVSVSQVQVSLDGVPQTGDVGGLSHANLLNYLIVPSGDILDGAATHAQFTWIFNSGTQAFDFLAAGQTLSLQYTIVPADAYGAGTSAVVTVNIAGSNDAPTLDDTTLAFVAGNESDPSGSTIRGLFANKFHDADTGAAFKAVAVTSNAATPIEGVWQYEIAGADQWVDIGSVSDAHGLVLSPDTLIRFVPANGFTGTPHPLGVHALDDTYIGGITTTSAIATTDITAMSTGGTAPVSHDLTTIGITVTAPPASGPVINTEHVQVENIIENSNEIITDLVVTDTHSGAATDAFTVTVSTAHPDVSIVSVYPTSGSLEQINSGLASGAGIAYDPTGASTDDYPTPPATDQITLTVTDTTTGQSDTVHFIFNEAGNTSQGVTLEGTSGKDVIFATDTNDTLIGGGGKDQFVFAPGAIEYDEDGHPVMTDFSHTITDFTAGLDKIDLRQFSDVSSIGNLTIVQQQNSDDTLVTWQQQVTPQVGAPVTEHESLLLKNVIAANLKASDFIFHIT